MIRSMLFFLSSAISWIPSSATCLPELSRLNFSVGEEVKLKVKRMTSIQTMLPMEYYKLPFCTPPEGPKMDIQTLEELFAGDQIESSPYRLFMQTEMYCEQVCISNLGMGEASEGVKPNKLKHAIRKNYHNNWIIDNLSQTRYWGGFPIGYIADKKTYVNNHVNIEIIYIQDKSDPSKYRIVQFTVKPFSIKHVFDVKKDLKLVTNDHVLPTQVQILNPIKSCKPDSKVHTTYNMATLAQPQEADGPVLFTYDVIWKESVRTIRWNQSSMESKNHWLSISNSLVVVLMLLAMIAVILVRNLHGVTNRYNKAAIENVARARELQENVWKLLHADVFRPPSYSPLLLSVLCGSGAQLLCTTLFILIFSTLGFINPSRRGNLLMGGLVFLVLMGCVNGYTTARLYKAFKGKSWQRATATAALALPGFAFGIILVIHIVGLIHDSTTDAVPFVTLLILVVMWFGISSPLVFFGAYVGYKQDVISFPVTTSSIPRQIPDQPWFMGVPITLAIGGILPFGSCYVGLHYVMTSVWTDHYYCLFGIRLLIFIISIITCAEITIIFTYFQLNNGDYHWWWRSFCNAGSVAIYVFLYSFVYFKQLEASSVSAYFVYFSYMGLCSIALFCMMGFIGLSTSLWFNTIIFSSIKND